MEKQIIKTDPNGKWMLKKNQAGEYFMSTMNMSGVWEDTKMDPAQGKAMETGQTAQTPPAQATGSTKISDIGSGASKIANTTNQVSTAANSASSLVNTVKNLFSIFKK